MAKAGSGGYRGERAGCSCVFGALGHFTDSSTHRKAQPDSSTHRKAKPAGRRAVTREVCARGPRSAVASSVNAPVPPGESPTGSDCASIETSHAQRGGGTWTDGLDCIDIDSTVASAFNLVPMESPGAPRGQSHGSRTKGQQTRSLISSGACQERGSSPPATRRPSGHTSMRLKPMRHSY